MDQNPWQRLRQRRQERRDRWNDRFEHVPRQLNELRLRLHRSRNGLALGVFSGIAESLGYSVCWTRTIGCFVLFSISGSVGSSGFKADLLVAGFFYLLAAVLMRGPDGQDAIGSRRSQMNGNGADRPTATPPPYPARSAARPAAVPYQEAIHVAPRVDFAALDRQLEGLNRRIQRMEGIVTDRHYDWDRRMKS